MLKHPKSGTQPPYCTLILHIIYTGPHTFHNELPCYYSSLTDIHTKAANLTTATVCHYYWLVLCKQSVEWAMLIQ